MNARRLYRAPRECPVWLVILAAIVILCGLLAVGAVLGHGRGMLIFG